MQNNNPYEILGVKESDSFKHINAVYNDFLRLLHSDRSNTIEAKELNMTPEEKNKYLKLIRNAYKQIVNIRKEINYPDYEMSYDIDKDMKINLIGTGLSVDDATNFNNSKFNNEFNKTLERDRKVGMDDPFNRGYGEFSAGKSFVDSKEPLSLPSYNHDIPVEKPKIFAKPDMKDDRIVEHVPESGINLSGLQHQELGIVNVSDFGMTTTGKDSIIGSDLNSVYGTNNEFWGDSIKRDSYLSNKYTDEGDIRKKLSSLESDRGMIYDMPIDEKLMSMEIDKNNLIKQQEILRKKHLDERDNYFNELNMGRLPDRF